MRLLYGSGAGTCQATQMIGRCHLGAAASPNRISAGRLSLAAGSALFVNAAGLVQRRRLTLQRSRFLCFSTPRRKSIGRRAVASEGDDFASLTHPNYTTQDKETYAGGWLAHRAAPDAEPGSGPGNNWVLEVAPAITRADFTVLGRKPRILVLYGSLRESSFSRKLAHEFARLFEVLGCDVRTYDPRGLPVRDPSIEDHAKVQEIRALSMWSDGHMWVSPEMHGTVTGAFKNQIDWLPLNTGSVRPTQGRTCCVAQVNGGSQSFNVVNTLRQLARWMRMPCCTNQSSVPKAWQEFDDDGRMKDSPLRDRVIDVAEEFVKYTAVLTPVADDLVDRYSERREKEEEGRLLTQAEKEERKSKGT